MRFDYVSRVASGRFDDRRCPDQSNRCHRKTGSPQLGRVDAGRSADDDPHATPLRTQSSSVRGSRSEVLFRLSPLSAGCGPVRTYVGSVDGIQIQPSIASGGLGALTEVKDPLGRLAQTP